MIRDRQTDRRTFGQTDGRLGKNNMSPDPEGGRHNNSGEYKQISIGKMPEQIQGINI